MTLPCQLANANMFGCHVTPSVCEDPALPNLHHHRWLHSVNGTSSTSYGFNPGQGYDVAQAQQGKVQGGFAQTAKVVVWVIAFFGMWPHIFGGQNGFVSVLEEQQLETDQQGSHVAGSTLLTIEFDPLGRQIEGFPLASHVSLPHVGVETGGFSHI